MNARELRYGNLVFDGGNRIVRIESINDIEVRCFELGKDSMYDELEYPLCSLSSIPLTEEILIELGFVKKEGKFYKEWQHYSKTPGNYPFAQFVVYWYEYHATGESHECWACQMYNYDYGKWTFSDIITFAPTLTVHRLQNLFYAVTGTELTYQPRPI